MASLPAGRTTSVREFLLSLHLFRRPLVALVALGLVGAGITARVAVASGTAPRPAVGFVAAATADRMRPLPPPNFPLQPTPRCVVLNNFGDPRSGGRRHEGEDILATLGQEVYAMSDGVLTYQSKVGDGTNGSLLSGNLWKLTRADGTYYIYAHLSAFAPGLEKGQNVYRGQVLGYVGDTGNPGPGNYHLHFELHPGGGAAVDPLPLLTVPASCTVYS